MSVYLPSTVRHLKYEDTILENPPIIFELPMPGGKVDYRGMYAILDETTEDYLELWYIRNLPVRIDQAGFSPVVYLYHHKKLLGKFHYNNPEITFYWQHENK